MKIFPEGDGIFETIKTIDGVPQFLNRHVIRAEKSARALAIVFPSREDIARIIQEVIATSPVSGTGRLRVTFPVSGEVFAIHEPFIPWSSPARVTLLDSVIDEKSPLAGHKVLPYSENLRLLESVRSMGFDDGIRLNSSGYVCESTIGNVIMKMDDRWITPTLASGALPGITRAVVIEWLDVYEEDLLGSDLSDVESIFLLSSLKNLQPVEFLDDRKLEINVDLLQVVRARTSQDLVD